MNRKTALSKRILKESLIEMLTEKKLSAISVKSLCEKADLNRSTFYAHYEDIYYLVSEIEDEIIRDMPFITYSENLPKKEIENYISYTAKNYKTIIALMKNGCFVQKTVENSLKYLSDELTGDSNEERFIFLSNFYIGGLFQALLYWSESHQHLSIEELSRMVYDLLNEMIKLRLKYDKKIT